MLLWSEPQKQCGKLAALTLETAFSLSALQSQSLKSRMVLTAGALPQSGGWGWTTIPPGDPACLFLHKGRREVLWDAYGRSLLIKDSLFSWSSSPLTVPPLHLSLHPYFMLNAQRKRHWWKSANYRVLTGFARDFSTHLHVGDFNY